MVFKGKACVLVMDISGDFSQVSMSFGLAKGPLYIRARAQFGVGPFQNILGLQSSQVVTLGWELGPLI